MLAVMYGVPPPENWRRHSTSFAIYAKDNRKSLGCEKSSHIFSRLVLNFLIQPTLEQHGFEDACPLYAYF